MKILQGIAAAPGLIISTAHVIHPLPEVDTTRQRTSEVQEETTRLAQAIELAISQLDKLSSAANDTTADILAAQREMLDDPDLKQGAEELIATGFAAEAAITQVANNYAEQLASLPDPYLAARAADVYEAGRRIVAALRGISLEVRLDRAAILVAQDLSPAETVGLDTAYLQAIVTETGSATGHLAIVAQGLGIPAVVGVSTALAQIDEGTTLIVDGNSGTITIAPDEASRARAKTQLAAAQREKQDLEIYRDKPGLTARIKRLRWEPKE